LTTKTILPVGVYDGVGRWEIFANLVVVDDDGIDPSARRFIECLKACRAAVDGHDQARAAFNQ